MIVTSVYVCEVCGERYASHDKCHQCESNHKRPVGIHSKSYMGYARDRTGYPVSIIVEMDDGTMVEYRR